MIIDLGAATQTWALLTEDGADVLAFDAMLSVDISAENQVAYEPVENGSFASYNKAASPTQLRVTLARSGTSYDQQAMLDTLERLCGGTDLVTLVTPAQEYAGYNLESYTYSRKSDNGAQLLVVELSLVEIRQVETQATTTVTALKPAQVKNASDASIANTGKVQAKEPNEGTRRSFAKELNLSKVFSG